MGHVDGLSRLHTQTVCAVSLSELMKDVSSTERESLVPVGEGSSSDCDDSPVPMSAGNEEPSRVVAGALEDALRVAKQALAEVGERPAVIAAKKPPTSTSNVLNPETPDEGATVSVGEPPASPENASTGTGAPDHEYEADADDETSEEEEDAERVVTSPVDLFGLDRERFVAEQKRTPWIQAVIAFVEHEALALNAQLRVKVLQMAHNYVVRDGMLLRKVHLKARAGPARSITVPVIPLPFVESVLHYCHSDVFAAHVGQTKTLDKVRKHAYWHGWQKDVIEYVRACSVCGSGKGYRPWKNGLMQRMPVQELSGPFSLLVVDAIGPLVTTQRGNKFILVFADYFTRWVEAFPVAALDTITFVNIMVDEVLSRHELPERLLSDRGSNFVSELAKSFYETLGIKKLYGAAYHPQTQGLVERFNGTLIGMLRMFVSETQSDWDLYLPRVLFAYRTSYHEALGDSPFFSLYGRDPVLPLDLAFLNTKNEWKSNEVAEYRRRLYLSLRDTRRLVERQLLKAQERHGRRLENQSEVTFEEGDAVWVYQYFRARRGERKTKKLAFSWHGPYRIVGKLGDNTYKVAIPNHPDRVVSINVNRLKRFAGRWSRPFPSEVPTGVESRPDADDNGPLSVGDLPATSFVERLTLGGEETTFSGVTSPIVDILAKRVKRRQKQYLVLTAAYETLWRSASSILPEFAILVNNFESELAKEKGWPKPRRSARLAEANAAVDEDELLF
ncbi:hypothetical protein PR001_g15390 [Phytophthora rubi]|uniref:Integrase catalytic domain-containing protein n=1 Tax=Phytophthora rubi TaxID=129364 RepID=A0A6A3JM85_9STRA|nr:hypothetical protein PR002_g19717 [Phytophthora rubi]KAE9013517.1 hypothetical protein PR001_g15390 [Phytophthora rubi]